jgi:hypothetical protein
MQHEREQGGYLGQVRYRLSEDWVNVSAGRTRSEAVDGAALAFHTRRDAAGNDAFAVRVLRVDTPPR